MRLVFCGVYDLGKESIEIVCLFIDAKFSNSFARSTLPYSSNDIPSTYLLVLTGMQCLRSNSIQVSSPASRDTPSSSLFILLQDSNLFKSLQHLPLNTATPFEMTSGTSSTILAASMDFSQSTNANRFAEVYMSCDCGSSNVEPIRIVWG